jgi:hypothetical protein
MGAQVLRLIHAHLHTDSYGRGLLEDGRTLTKGGAALPSPSTNTSDMPAVGAAADG